MFRSLPPRPRKRQSYASLILPPAIIQLPRPVAAGGEVPRPCRAAPRRAPLRSAEKRCRGQRRQPVRLSATAPKHQRFLLHHPDPARSPREVALLSRRARPGKPGCAAVSRRESGAARVASVAARSSRDAAGPHLARGRRQRARPAPKPLVGK